MDITLSQNEVAPIRLQWIRPSSGVLRAVKYLGFALIWGVGPFYVIMFEPYTSNSPFGMSLGGAGLSLMVIGAVMYSLRKRVAALKKRGKLSGWLSTHIMMCLAGPTLVMYHATFNILAPNSGVAVYSMLIVVGSGLFGKYIHGHILQTLGGERAGLKQLEKQRQLIDLEVAGKNGVSQRLLDKIQQFFALRMAGKNVGVVRSFYLLLKLDVLERRILRLAADEFNADLLARRHLAPRERAMLEVEGIQGIAIKTGFEKRIALMEATERAFRFWHHLHLPLLVVLVITVLFHLVAVLLF
ncbi:MAG: hypothetical protein HY207_02175 [Nitrospirae bacterium]|nr:hypothetical protein [Nitrospirota bacterium]